MSARRWFLGFIEVLLLGVVLAGCAQAVPTVVVTETVVPEPTRIPATWTPLPSPPPTATAAPSATLEPESRLVEAEWPSYMRLGDSDIVRLSLVPMQEGYVARVEYEGHTLDTEQVEIPTRAGYSLSAVARLDAAGVEVSPGGDVSQDVLVGEPVDWHWTIYPNSAGRHRLHLHLRLRWTPSVGQGDALEHVLWQGGLEIHVGAPMGLAAPQARILGIAGLLLGGVLVLPLVEFSARRRIRQARARRVREVQPNPQVVLEGSLAQELGQRERTILQAVFAQYDRVRIKTEFQSGYSGARTWLLQPLLPDGRAQAHTIVKIGSRRQIMAETMNYEAFVRHTLPPITARLQGPGVVVPGLDEAALQYTFVGAPGDPPRSLRTFALTHTADETAHRIEERLFGTFGPSWWMQRQPYAFTMSSEYDRLLPVHLLIEPQRAKNDVQSLTGRSEQLHDVQPGATVCLRGATVVETRPERGTMTLAWPQSTAGPMRVRVQDEKIDRYREGQVLRQYYGRVVSLRSEMLKALALKAVHGMDLDSVRIVFAGRDLPNPLQHVETLLARHMQGSRAVIHGDLNLENVLVGPGDLLWLIDFAATREGHAIFDFARLEVELATQVIAAQFYNRGLGVEHYLDVLERLDRGETSADGLAGQALQMIAAVRRIAGRCLFDPADDTELRCALALAYLGSLKFSNLDDLPGAPFPKALAFSAAAYMFEGILLDSREN